MANAIEPTPFNIRKRVREMPLNPAKGDATTFIPGMNFDTSKVQVPRWENIFCVRRTQLSGSSDARQINFKTDPPRLRPISNQHPNEDNGYPWFKSMENNSCMVLE